MKKKIFNVGSINVDMIKSIDYQSDLKIFNKLNIKKFDKYCMLTLHPANLEKNFDAEKYLKNIFCVLDKLKIKTIISYPSMEIGSNKIIKIIKKKTIKFKRYKLVKSLGFNNYNKLLKKSLFLIGNSSSGIYEAPYHRIPSINIGDRQKGRIMHKSVIQTSVSKFKIEKAVRLAVSGKFKKKIRKMKFLFGDGNTSKKITKILSKLIH